MSRHDWTRIGVYTAMLAISAVFWLGAVALVIWIVNR